MKLLRKFLKGTIETNAARIFGRVFWPPCASAIMAEGEHDDILALNAGEHYELPGGIIDQGEDMKEAAKREAKEETGFDVEVGDLMDIRVSDNTGSIQFFFEGKVVGGDPKGSWEGEPEFIPKEEIEDKVWRLEHSHIHEYLFPREG